MDDKVKALEEAAFHAWLTIGDHLTHQRRITREEWEMDYAALSRALDGIKSPPEAP